MPYFQFAPVATVALFLPVQLLLKSAGLAQNNHLKITSTRKPPGVICFHALILL